MTTDPIYFTLDSRPEYETFVGSELVPIFVGTDLFKCSISVLLRHNHGIESLVMGGTPSNTTFLRGDGVWATPVAGTSVHTHSMEQVSGLVDALANLSTIGHKHSVTDISATGNPNSATFLCGDGSWKAASSILAQHSHALADIALLQPTLTSLVDTIGNLTDQITGKSSIDHKHSGLDLLIDAPTDASFFLNALGHWAKVEISEHKHNVTDINASGTPSKSTFLCGDGSWVASAALVSAHSHAIGDLILNGEASENTWLRGDGSWHSLDGLVASQEHSHVSNDISDLIPTLSSIFSTIEHKHSITDIKATGTPSNSTFLRGDGSWVASSELVSAHMHSINSIYTTNAARVDGLLCGNESWITLKEYMQEYFFTDKPNVVLSGDGNWVNANSHTHSFTEIIHDDKNLIEALLYLNEKYASQDHNHEISDIVFPGISGVVLCGDGVWRPLEAAGDSGSGDSGSGEAGGLIDLPLNISDIDAGGIRSDKTWLRGDGYWSTLSATDLKDIPIEALDTSGIRSASTFLTGDGRWTPVEELIEVVADSLGDTTSNDRQLTINDILFTGTNKQLVAGDGTFVELSTSGTSDKGLSVWQAVVDGNLGTGRIDHGSLALGRIVSSWVSKTTNDITRLTLVKNASDNITLPANVVSSCSALFSSGLTLLGKVAENFTLSLEFSPNADLNLSIRACAKLSASRLIHIAVTSSLLTFSSSVKDASVVGNTVDTIAVSDCRPKVRVILSDTGSNLTISVFDAATNELLKKEQVSFTLVPKVMPSMLYSIFVQQEKPLFVTANLYDDFYDDPYLEANPGMDFIYTARLNSTIDVKEWKNFSVLVTNQQATDLIACDFSSILPAPAGFANSVDSAYGSVAVYSVQKLQEDENSNVGLFCDGLHEAVVNLLPLVLPESWSIDIDFCITEVVAPRIILSLLGTNSSFSVCVRNTTTLHIVYNEVYSIALASPLVINVWYKLTLRSDGSVLVGNVLCGYSSTVNFPVTSIYVGGCLSAVESTSAGLWFGWMRNLKCSYWTASMSNNAGILGSVFIDILLQGEKSSNDKLNGVDFVGNSWSSTALRTGQGLSAIGTQGTVLSRNVSFSEDFIIEIQIQVQKNVSCCLLDSRNANNCKGLVIVLRNGQVVVYAGNVSESNTPSWPMVLSSAATLGLGLQNICLVRTENKFYLYCLNTLSAFCEYTGEIASTTRFIVGNNVDGTMPLNGSIGHFRLTSGNRNRLCFSNTLWRLPIVPIVRYRLCDNGNYWTNVDGVWIPGSNWALLKTNNIAGSMDFSLITGPLVLEICVTTNFSTNVIVEPKVDLSVTCSFWSQLLSEVLLSAQWTKFSWSAVDSPVLLTIAGSSS